MIGVKTLEYCKICGEKTITYQHPRFDMTFHECLSCEFIFKDQSNYISKSEELKKYDEHNNSEEHIGYVNFLTNFLEAAVYPFVSHGKALDFGSGPNPVLAKILGKTSAFDVDIYDLFYAPDPIYLNQTYDLITSTEVIEHLRNPMKVFQTFYDHLRPGGYLSIMTLFHPKDQKILFDWFYIRDQTHVSFYTPKTIETIAQIIGFELIETNDYRYAVLKKSI